MNEDFSLGKMSADARLTATFKYYAKTEQNGEINNHRLSGQRAMFRNSTVDTAWTEMSSGFL